MTHSLPPRQRPGRRIGSRCVPLLLALLAGCGGNPPDNPKPRQGEEEPVPAPVPKADCGDASINPTAAAATGFYTPVNVSGTGLPELVADGLSEHPVLAVSATPGEVYVAWDDNASGEKEVMVSRSGDAGAHFAVPVNVSKSGTAHFPALAVDTDDRVHVAWEDTRAGQSQIFYAHSDDEAASFSAAVNLSRSMVPARSVSLAIGPDDAVYATWVTEHGITIQRSTNAGGQFSAYASYTAGDTVLPATPSTVVDAAGTLHLSWGETVPDSSSSSGVIRSVRYAQVPANAALSTPLLLDEGKTLSQPTLAADAEGKVYVAYRNEDDKDIYLVRSSDGGLQFSAPANVTRNAGISLDPSLVVDGAGTLYLVWTDTSDGNYDSFFASSQDHGLSFTAPLNFAPSAQGSLFTAVAVDTQQNVYAAWDDNRYPNSEGALSNEGNFEILVARGRQGLPAVQRADTDTCPFSPDGDQHEDRTTLTASFSKLLSQWTVDIFDAEQRLVHSVSSDGAASSLSYLWDGQANQLAGALAADGEYRYSISGVDAEGFTALPATGALIVNTVAEATPPTILLDDDGQSSFQREAFAFSPNGDGFKDTDGVAARFNKPVNWTLSITDAGRQTVRTFSGSGLSIEPQAVFWDGRDDSGLLLVDGTYRLTLSIVDGHGQQASCGAQPTICPTMEVDTESPALDNVQVTASFSAVAGQTATVSGVPTETSLVTVYVYAKGGTQVRAIDRAYHDAGEAFSLDWDGKDNAGNTVAPGDYVVNVWCRDRAGNTAETYPYELPVRVTAPAR